MARDVTDDTYYITKGGKIPVKWTAPEVILWTYVQHKGMGLNKAYFGQRALNKKNSKLNLFSYLSTMSVLTHETLIFEGDPIPGS